MLSAGLAGSVALAPCSRPPSCSPPSRPARRSAASWPRIGAAARWLVGAGLLAVAAALIKQSFLDAGFAGAVFLVAAACATPPAAAAAPALRGRRAAPAGGRRGWRPSPTSPPGASSTRCSASASTRCTRSRPRASRSTCASEPARDPRRRLRPVRAARHRAGGLWTLRARPRARRHARRVARGRRRRRARRRQLLAALPDPARRAGERARPARRSRGSAAAGSSRRLAASRSLRRSAATSRHARPRSTGRLRAASYVRRHARPGDTQYVMYARANVGYYAGLPSPYPYAWSLLVRAHPGATARLRQLLASPRRPTWIVGWQPPDRWGLDPGGATPRSCTPTTGWSPTCTATRSTTARPPQGAP